VDGGGYSADFLSRFSEAVEYVWRVSGGLGVRPVEREDGLVLASLSYYITLLGGRVFVDAGAGVGYSTAWILYGISGANPRGRVSLYAVERNPQRFRYLRECIERVRASLPVGGTEVEVSLVNGDAVDFLEEGVDQVDLVFVDIDKRRYVDVLKFLPRRLSPIGLAIFHNALVPGLDEEAREFLERQNQLTYYVIPTSLGLLVVKRVS
jgi:predicted O-methyltransferase YrrM